jgi:hypothetical protein
MTRIDYSAFPILREQLELKQIVGEASPLQVQVGGDHYKKYKIQPVEYIHANSIPFIEGSIIKYVTRWRDKNGVKDLEKAKHFIDLLIDLESKNEGS